MDGISSYLPMYLGLLLAGILLVGLEIYIPGGIVGTIGALVLVAAMVVGFRFPEPYGILSALAILAGCVAGIYWWACVFPRTRAGRRFSLEKDGKDFRSDRPEWKGLIGKTGRTITALHPAGIAQIDGHRVDVTTASAWMDSGVEVRVTAVHGLRVIVEPAAAPEAR
ncbi:MAG: NfeD family protein [Kiritimatiellae bacterium]|nr:NfeD family protein [Kiritimatiellia bacterium]